MNRTDINLIGYRLNPAGTAFKIPEKFCKCNCGQLVQRAGSDFVFGHKNPWLILNKLPTQNNRYVATWIISKPSKDHPGMYVFFCKPDGKHGHWVYMEQFAKRFDNQEQAEDYAYTYGYREAVIEKYLAVQ